VDREDKDSIQNDYIDKLLQKIYGYTDEQILKDFEEAEKDDDSYPDFPVYPDEFDRIWEDIQAERATRTENKPEKEEEEGTAATVVELPRKARKIRWKRVAIAGVAACLVTLSVCFVAVGKKSYFYREREKNSIGNNVIFNNDSLTISVNDQEAAYNAIEEKLGKPLRLGYIPSDLKFDELEIDDRQAIIKFSYKDNIVYFCQSKDQTEASNGLKSDGKKLKNVTNKWLNKEITIKEEGMENGQNRYEARFFYKDINCWIYGTIEENEFTKIVERITY